MAAEHRQETSPGEHIQPIMSTYQARISDNKKLKISLDNTAVMISNVKNTIKRSNGNNYSNDQ